MFTRGRPLHVGVQLQAQATSWANYFAAVKAVEDLGYGSVWTFDHILPFSGADDRPCFETLTTLGALALGTRRARFGALVAGVLYRDPAVLAKAAAQADEISAGRFEFTLGAAWAEREFRAYGWDFPPLAERYERLDEALQVVKLLWAQHRTTFEGRFYRLADAPCEPKPVQQPRPPITIGGAGPRSIAIAALHADRLNLIGSPEQCAQRFARLQQECAGIGRDPDEIELSVHPTLALGPSRAEGERLARVIAEGNGDDLASVRDSWLIGGPEDVLHRMRQYGEAGVSHFVLAVGPPFDMGPLRVLAEEVLPHL